MIPGLSPAASADEVRASRSTARALGALVVAGLVVPLVSLGALGAAAYAEPPAKFRGTQDGGS